MNKYSRHNIFIKIDNKYVEVYATLLGGEEGIFGVCRDPNNYDIIWLLSGDDGAWWCIASYHKDWLPGIIASLCTEKGN